MADDAVASAPADADASLHAQAERMHPRSDLKDAIGWLVFGTAVLIGSIRMERLESQHINPYTVPGLLPGLLGIAMILLGAVLAVRSWERGALREGVPALTADQRDEWRRIGIVLLLCIGYGVVLIGHGIPFWVASSIYVTASILILQRMSREAQQREMSVRAIVKAVVIGVSASVVTQLVFQEVFLVRMP